jgi:16S rRNA (guanine527-N7)-methyltransferase
MKIGSQEWSHLIIAGAKSFGLQLEPDQTEQFAVHATEVIQWNQRMNLTSITRPLDIAIKHFLDSLAPAHLIAPGAALLDIGSGGGFPGIPLKVINPSSSVTLIDASRKKVNFIQHMIRTLNLDNTHALHSRAEELADDPAHMHRYDVVISRALSALDAFVALALPLLAEKGIIIALKGVVSQRELDDLKRNVFEKMDRPEAIQKRYSLAVKKYSLPVLNSKRSMITVKRSESVSIPMGGQ